MGDDPVQSRAASRALRAASLIAVTTPVLCEFVWVLSRAYKRPGADIADAIRRLLVTATVVADRPAAEAGLAFLDAGGDFADGVIAHAGRALGAEVFLTFDEDAAGLVRRADGTAKAP